MDGVLYNELKKTRSAIEVRLSALDAAIEALQKTQASSLSKINDTYLICKDILTGQQVSDWVADLKAYGTSSETYANSSRMTTLVNSSDAVGDSGVTKTILGWSLDNAMVGTYFGTLTGDTTVSWSSLTTADELVSSEDAFAAMCSNDDAWSRLRDTNALKTATANIFSTTLASYVKNSAAVKERLDKESTSELTKTGASVTYSFKEKHWYVYDVNASRYFEKGSCTTALGSAPAETTEIEKITLVTSSSSDWIGRALIQRIADYVSLTWKVQATQGSATVKLRYFDFDA